MEENTILVETSLCEFSNLFIRLLIWGHKEKMIAKYKAGDKIKVGGDFGKYYKPIYPVYGPDWHYDMDKWINKEMTIKTIFINHRFRVEENEWTWVIGDIVWCNRKNYFSDIIKDMKI